MNLTPQAGLRTVSAVLQLFRKSADFTYGKTGNINSILRGNSIFSNHLSLTMVVFADYSTNDIKRLPAKKDSRNKNICINYYLHLLFFFHGTLLSHL